MAAAPKEKAAAAGAIETMSYELGAGLGIAIFGLLLTRSFSASIVAQQHHQAPRLPLLGAEIERRQADKTDRA